MRMRASGEALSSKLSYNEIMTDIGTHIIVDAGETGLQELLELVGKEGRSVRICVAGRPVAEMTPVPRRRQLLPVDPSMKVTFLTDDPVRLTTEEDWPEHLRVKPDDPGAKQQVEP